jgi:MFS family permease
MQQDFEFYHAASPNIPGHSRPGRKQHLTPAGAPAEPAREASSPGGPVGHVSPGWIGAVTLANLGLFMAYFGPLEVLLPNQIQAVAGAHRIVDFSWVSGLGAVIAIVANPLAGALSDRTASRFGRRRPWVLGGALAAAAALCAVGFLHSVPEIVAGWCLAQVGVNMMQAGLAAAVPDRVPTGQRGTVSGWVGIAQTISVVAAAGLLSKVAGSRGYLLLAAGVVALALPYVCRTADPPLADAARPEFRWRSFARSFAMFCWPSGWTHDFRWAWLTRFLLVLGNAMAVVYLLYFLRRIGYSTTHPGHSAEQGLAILLASYTVAVAATTVIAGRRSDRTGRRRQPVMFGGVLMAAAMVLVAARPTWPVLLAAAPVIGIGFGVYLSVDQALATQVLPSAAERAKSLGLISVASSAGQAVAPALAAPTVTYLGGFSTLYLCAASAVLLGSVSVWRIRSVP